MSYVSRRQFSPQEPRVDVERIHWVAKEMPDCSDTFSGMGEHLSLLLPAMLGPGAK